MDLNKMAVLATVSGVILLAVLVGLKKKNWDLLLS